MHELLFSLLSSKKISRLLTLELESFTRLFIHPTLFFSVKWVTRLWPRLSLELNIDSMRVLPFFVRKNKTIVPRTFKRQE